MTRYAIDAHTAVRLVREGLTVSGHQLVAPIVLRSQAMSMIYRATQSGEISEPDARTYLDRLTTMRVRLLGDRMSRGTAWRLASKLGWSDTADAEYIAVAQLQADVLVAGDESLARRAQGLVELAPYELLVSESSPS